MPKTVQITADTVFRAFADETRLRILHLLVRGEICVGDLVAILQVPQPTASRHLTTLRRAGLVEVRKQGLWRFYRLAQSGSRLQRRLLDCVASCLGEVPEIAADVARAERVAKSGGCCP